MRADVGICCQCGPRARNEDCAASVRDGGALLAAVADGVTFGGGGLEAARSTVGVLMSDFFAAPADWPASRSFERILGAHSAWLAAHNRHRARGAAMTTLTALAFDDRGWALAHVGDTRAWRLRDGAIEQLSGDHGFDDPALAGQLTRAIGLDDWVRIDHRDGDLRAGDAYLLTSDGVHGTLSGEQLLALAGGAATAQQAADAIVSAALAAGSTDNATALVVRVFGVDAAPPDG